VTWTETEIAKVLVGLELIKEGVEIKIRRTYSGYCQKSIGAWSWWAIRLKPNMEICGSQYTCRSIIKAYKENKGLLVIYYSNNCAELIVESEK